MFVVVSGRLLILLPTGFGFQIIFILTFSLWWNDFIIDLSSVTSFPSSFQSIVHDPWISTTSVECKIPRKCKYVSRLRLSHWRLWSWLKVFLTFNHVWRCTKIIVCTPPPPSLLLGWGEGGGSLASYQILKKGSHFFEGVAEKEGWLFSVGGCSFYINNLKFEIFNNKKSL